MGQAFLGLHRTLGQFRNFLGVLGRLFPRAGDGLFGFLHTAEAQAHEQALDGVVQAKGAFQAVADLVTDFLAIAVELFLHLLFQLGGLPAELVVVPGELGLHVRQPGVELRQL